MAVSDTLINTLFDGRYRVLRKLGAGGMANVYLAEDQELGRRVAIKILNDRHAHDDQFVERFRREAKNAAGLSHPNIVSIYDRGEAQGTYYIAMEYLEGRSLKELILTRGPSPIRVAIEYARQILAALRFAHRNGIVHRDIKPHNVLVDDEGRVKVTDFGIARAGASQMTEAGAIIGTAQYLSPEQARGAPVDQTSDLYSLGVVLSELLTGEVPFMGDTPVEIAMKHLSQVPEPPSRKRPEIPRDLDLIVLRALAKDPADRYQSAEEMDADLERVARGLAVSTQTAEAATSVLAGPVLTGEPTAVTPRRPPRAAAAPPAYPPTPYYGYEEPPRRRRSVWPWLVALGLLVGVGVAGWYVYTQIQHQLNASKPVAVPFVIGIREAQAMDNVRREGLRPQVRHQPDPKTQAGFVSSQEPAGGDRISKGSTVTIVVSTGLPRTTVPAVVGKTLADATAALADARLKWKVFEINSGKAVNTVTGQDPQAGSKVDQQLVIRINVSKGPKSLAVPPVIGESFEQASSDLKAKGFNVSRLEVGSSEPRGTVVKEEVNGSPAANRLQPAGSTITLSVSKGRLTIPDVTSKDKAMAVATLRAAGFGVVVLAQNTTDPSQDGVVLGQNPPAGTEALPKTPVTIDVGHLVQATTATTPSTETTPTQTTPTETTPTQTTPTQTTPTQTTPTQTTPTQTTPTQTTPTQTTPTQTTPTQTTPTQTTPTTPTDTTTTATTPQ